jgi:coenzyme F420-0:L-glutamate ligase / coenzyme F420-1:gamma-L-glutamate ligase
MPNLSNAIKERRSIRKYQAKEVSKEVVKELLIAAGSAPSAHNAQPWRFLVLADAGVKRELALAMTQAWAEDLADDDVTINKEMRKARVERSANAPVLILACLTMDGMQKFNDKKRQKIERDLAIQSLGAAIENLLLAAHAAGLGACWYCAPSFCKDKVREMLEIPKPVEPHAFITLGYPCECPEAPPRKKFGDYCFVDIWGKPLG